MDHETEATKVKPVGSSGPREVQELWKWLAASWSGACCEPSLRPAPPALGALTAAGLAVGVQGVAPAAAAVVPILRVGAFVLTAWLAQCAVVDS